MTTPVHTTKGWPTELQVLLLRACLLEGAEADMAYTAWRPQVELEHLDPNSNFLLSLLQTKGADKKETSEAMALMLKGTYRYVRTRNSALLGSATAPMKAFQEAGIDVMLLNGMATARHYYNDLGARRMHDIDILVPTGRAVDAMRILRDNGWAPGIDRPERSVGVRNGCHFYNKLGLALDLHWHALLECGDEHADKAFWDASEEIQVNGLNVRVLNPTDQLLHTLVCGLSRYFTPPVRWAADAWTIIKTRGKDIDWDRLAQQAESRRLNVTVAKALGFLALNLDPGIPAAELDRIQSLPSTKAERLEHLLKLRWQKYLGALPLFWFSHRRRRRASGTSWGFLRALQYSFGLEHLRQLPWHMISIGVRRTRKVWGT